MTKKVASHIWLICALTIGMIVIVAGACWSLAASRDDERSAARGEQALRELGWLMAEIMDAETARQAYVADSQERYVAAYHLAASGVERRLDTLSQIVEKDSDQAGRIAALQRLVSERLGSGIAPGTDPSERAGSMDEIRSIGQAIAGREQELLAGSMVAAAAAERQAQFILLIGGSILTVILALAAITAARDIARPLAHLLAGGSAIAGGDFAHRIAVAARDEFGALAELFNNIAIRLKAEHTMNQRASAELREVNEELVARGTELEARGRIIDVLGKMAHRLQSCDSEEEFADVVRRFASQILPHVPGALYLLNNSRNLLRAAAEWNGPRHHRQEFRPLDCWALRRGHAHVVSGVDVEVTCHHVEESADLSYLCFPMLAQGETLGLLYIEKPPSDDADRHAAAEAAIADHWRIEIMVENIALALGNHRLREALRIQSIRDPLTGLFNRRYLEETLELEFARASRAKAPLSVMMLDVDHFKRFNDSFGHDAGDAVLKAVGQVLAGGMRRGDVTCRYGGEEFTIFAPGAGLEDAARRADTLRQAVAAINLVHNGRPLGSVTCSFGVAQFPVHGATPAEVLQAADEALYRAKQAGRNRVELALPGQTATVAIDSMRVPARASDSKP